jgi:hypothetical protein
MLTLLSRFAQDYSYTTYTVNSDSSGMSGGVAAVLLIILLPILIITIVGMWKVFKKAGEPGWAAIIPIYNSLVLLRIIGRPWWWIFLFLLGFIPFIGSIVVLVVSAVVHYGLAKSFGKDVGMTVLLLLLPPIGYGILGFGDAKYHGPSASQGGAAHTGGPAAPTHPTTPAAV